jgi:deoxyribose-phosphate aldolase
MDLALFIDHTVLKPDCTAADIRKVCEEAIEHRFAAVCIPPFFVKEAAQLLDGKGTKIATVVGFPMGYSAVPAKIEEIKRALDEGVTEIDAVVNIAAVKNGNWNFVRNEVESLTTACHMRGKIIKIIFETGLLTDEEIRKLCDICTEIKVDFVKTSTGFLGPGATVEVIKSLRKRLPKSIKIKASGGIRERKFAEELVQAGADRIGASASIQLL